MPWGSEHYGIGQRLISFAAQLGMCASEDLLSILLTNNRTRISMITTAMEICVTAARLGRGPL